MGKKTNLIPSENGEIYDIYECFRKELLDHLSHSYKNEGKEQVFISIKDVFTRKLVKLIFMPMIYGKTKMSTCDDLRGELMQHINVSECYKLTEKCYQFWKNNYEHMENLIQLIRLIGWFSSISDRPVQ